MNKNGFTLIEITIALLILAVGLVGLLTLFPVGFDASARAGDVTQATFIGQRVIEEQKRIGYDSIVDVGDTTVAGGRYVYNVTAVSVTGIPGLMQVNVVVKWPASAAVADQRSVELVTYIADYEP